MRSGRRRGADVIVWVVTSGLRGGVRTEHAATLAKLNEAFAGSTVFHAVEVTYKSDPRPWGDPISKRWLLSLRIHRSPDLRRQPGFPEPWPAE